MKITEKYIDISFLAVIIALLIVMMHSCSKEETIIEDEYCWECTTLYKQTMYYRQYDPNPSPSIFESEITFNVCNTTEENIRLFEETATDSTRWYSGYIDNKVSRITKCNKQ